MICSRTLGLSGLFVMLLGFGLFAEAGKLRPVVSGGWRYAVFADGLRNVDNIVADRDRTLYVSLELAGGEGRIVRLRHGRRSLVLGDLRRPDGLALFSSSLFVTEEVENGRVLRLDLDGGGAELVTRLQKPEGIRPLPDGSLVISEDRKAGGRVVKMTAGGRSTTLAEGLQKPEGLALDRDGQILVAESGAGKILLVSDNGIREMLSGLHWPDQVAIAPDGAIWITEDADPGRVLRYSFGRLETVLDDVAKPQGIAFDGDGGIYVAEQGRNRILRIRRAL